MTTCSAACGSITLQVARVAAPTVQAQRLIRTPLLLAIALQMGMRPVRLGVVMLLNCAPGRFSPWLPSLIKGSAVC